MKRHSRSTAGPNTISGNRIDANDSGGILVNAGGSTIGPGNTFAENQDYGIRVALGNGTRITQNAIDDTFGAGIDLVGGANNNQTAPSRDVGHRFGRRTSRFKARWRAPPTRPSGSSSSGASPAATARAKPSSAPPHRAPTAAAT